MKAGIRDVQTAVNRILLLDLQDIHFVAAARKLLDRSTAALRTGQTKCRTWSGRKEIPDSVISYRCQCLLYSNVSHKASIGQA